MTFQDMLPRTGVVILSGKPDEVAQVVKNLDATTVEFQLIEKFGERGATDELPDSWIDFENALPPDTESGEPTTVILPGFRPIVSPEQSVICLETLRLLETHLFILCVERSQRKPVGGSRCWLELPEAVFEVKRDRIRNYRTGQELILHERPTCNEVLLRIMQDGVNYDDAQREFLRRGHAQSSFSKAVAAVAEVRLVPRVMV